MAWQRGDRLAGRFILERPVPGAAVESWYAVDDEGRPHLLRRRPPPGALAGLAPHPAVVVDEPVGEDASVRPWFDAPQEAPRGPQRLLAAGRRLAEALAALHGAGLAHGRVKPSNVLVGTGAPLRLVDAGSEGDPAEDVRAAAELIAAWAGADAPAALSETLRAARAGRIDAAELRDRLDDVGLAADRAGAPLPGQVQVDPGDGVARGTPGQRWSPRTLMAGAFGLAALLLLLTFALLPGPEPAPQAPPEAAAAPAPPEPESPDPPTAEELEALLAQRDAAQEVLDAFVALRLSLEERAVERWGAEALAAAVAVHEQGNVAFRAQDFRAAEAAYGEALARLEALAETGDEVLADALERGARALADGRSADAREAFELALAMDPEQAQAQAGQARAETLDEALALLAEAQAAEAAGALELAAERFRALADLDPAMPELAGALERIAGKTTDRDFRQAMSDGLAAMEIQDWARARERFGAAARLRPADPAPGEFLAEAERRARDWVLASHRRKAAEAVAAERWEDAASHYAAVLKREPKAREASEGLALAEARRDLYGALEAYTGNPAGWWSQDGRRQARDLLARAAAVHPPGPRLQALSARLAEQLELASQPVRVTLRSDNACNVVVYRVARLGSFQERQLELKPGRYTAVATRDGFRDVRKDFLVPAGGRPEPVVLRCEEPV